MTLITRVCLSSDGDIEKKNNYGSFTVSIGNHNPNIYTSYIMLDISNLAPH